MQLHRPPPEAVSQTTTLILVCLDYFTGVMRVAVGTGFASNTRCGQKYAESTGMDRMCFILLSFDSPENFRYRKSMCPKSSGFGKMKLLGESSIGLYGVKSVTIIAQP